MTEEIIPEPETGLLTRGRRRQNSRRKLLDAAKKLFVERGYHDTRPQDISREAGVGHGTFYLHFKDKRACFLAFVEEAQHGLDEQVQSHTANAIGLESRVKEIVRGVNAFIKANPNVLAAATSNPDVIGAGDDPITPLPKRWAKQWTAAMRQGVERGEVYDDYDLDIIGHAVNGVMTAVNAYCADADIDQEKQVENVTRFLVRALSPPSNQG